ncbi:type II secretion system F family protein [Paenibacillus cremeus]|uniref:Pilus assembly protein TadB n=1 Tax=Paenibacillus cremeus TaxID=2163881 RepID=A0A559KDD7_9BACL|nr:type II secretion system F family protein [Paenibacillus cremeus]TVY10119.1 pilus assembly protein TadB [Paenibacillus cremeus]
MLRNMRTLESSKSFVWWGKRQASEIIRGKESRKQLPDYDTYLLSWREFVFSSLWGAVVMGGIAYVFFKQPAICMIFALAGLSYSRQFRKGQIRKQKTQLKLQFKQMLAALSSALGAGRSVESALQEALSDLQVLYPDSGAMIVTELGLMVRRIENGETVEACLMGLSRRAHIEEIDQFAEVFVTCKRLGGSLVQVIRRTATILQDKLEIEQDIQVLLAQKRFEARVLSAAPIVIIALLAWSTPEYMEPLYHGGGLLIMGVALVVLFGCYLLTQKIMNIKV